MSLEALNSPPLVGILTVGLYGLGLPVAANDPLSVLSRYFPWLTAKHLNALAYGLSLYSVSQPGRYDGEASVADAQATYKGERVTNNEASEGMKQMGTGESSRTLLPPAPWAFAIWGPIFLGEFVMVTSPFVFPSLFNRPLVPSLQQTIREVTGPYVTAQLFQTLWTASFRPKYGSRGGIYKYVSALNLAGIAASLSLCHKAFAEASSSYSSLEYWMYFLPLTLHFGWTTAAALVNVNGMYALKVSGNGDGKSDNNSSADAKSVAILGHLSVAIATAIGVGVTLSRNAPVYGGTICWALSAVASGLKQKIVQSEKKYAEFKKTDDKDASSPISSAVGIYGAKTQRTLCLVGAGACALSVIAVVVGIKN